LYFKEQFYYTQVVIEMFKTENDSVVLQLPLVDSCKLILFLLQMHIDSHDALGVLNTLFEILAPSSLRPVDMLLRSMFVTPKTMVSK